MQWHSGEGLKPGKMPVIRCKNKPQGCNVGVAALREKGVDAMLTASARMAQDGKPDRASAQILDTASGDSLMDIAWQNAWGEMADQMRIASCEKALLRRLKKLQGKIRC